MKTPLERETALIFAAASFLLERERGIIGGEGVADHRAYRYIGSIQGVVGYSAGKIFSEVDFHMFYLKDIEDFAPPIANPMNPNVYGTRTGELKSFF